MREALTISPEQQAFARIRKICADLYGEANVFDYLPGEVPYPFIHIGDQLAQNVRRHKDGPSKDTQVVVHVWHDAPTERGRVTGMVHTIESAIYRTFGATADVPTVSITPDNTTAQPLLHATIDVDIRL